MFKRATTSDYTTDILAGDYYAGNVVIRKYRYFGATEWFVIVGGNLTSRHGTLTEAKTHGKTLAA